MTKSEILQALAEKLGITRKQVSEFMDAMVGMAYEVTKKEGEFVIPGMGKLQKKHRDARMGRNPATGASIQIPAKTVLKFRVAKQGESFPNEIGARFGIHHGFGLGKKFE